MKFTTKTEYGLICLIHLARLEQDQIVSIKDVAESEGLSQTYIEKIFQRLKASEIVKSHQGKQGGYSLARLPEEISLREIIETLEGATFEVYCEPNQRESITCNHFSMCGLRPIWQKTKSLLDDFYTSVSLKDLAFGTETTIRQKVA